VAFQWSVGGEPAEEQRGDAAGDARRWRDLWPVAAIWRRRETKPVWAGAGPSGLRRPIGQLGRFSRVGRREEDDGAGGPVNGPKDRVGWERYWADFGIENEN
jgi:hypothetical protein